MKIIGSYIVAIILMFLFFVAGHRQGERHIRKLYNIRVPEKGLTKVVVLGDSQVAKGHLGDELQLFLNKLDDGDHRYIVKTFGIVGESPRELWARREIAFDYDHVIILSGINQISEPAYVMRDLSALFQLLKAKEKLVIALTLPPWERYQGVTPQNMANWEVINEWLRMKPHNIDYVLDTIPVLKRDKPEMNRVLDYKYDTGDGLHVNEEGMRALGRGLFQWFYMGYLGQNLSNE